MNKDLEETLDELGPGCRAATERLLAAREVEPSGRATTRKRLPTLTPLLAASVTIALMIACLFSAAPVARRLFAKNAARPSRTETFRVYTVAYAPTEEALELIVATQRADGSWTNDFLTRQNAAALRVSSDARMRVAYRRAVRYLRSKGLSPLTDAELKARGEYAARAMPAT